MLALPQLLIAIGIVAACSPRRQGCLGRARSSRASGLVIAVIVLFSWSYIARIVRGITLSLREKEFVEAAARSARRTSRIIFARDPAEPRRPDHRLHDAADPDEHPVRGGALLPRARRAARPGLVGQILSDASQLYDVAWWLMVFPGLFLVVTTLAFNLLGDGLRDALDVRAER